MTRGVTVGKKCVACGCLLWTGEQNELSCRVSRCQDGGVRKVTSG